MTQPYRNETDALRERKAALAAESEKLKEQRAQLDWLTTREQEIERELSAIEEKLSGGGKRRLPTLDQISVASPCSASWDEMLGDERVRFCVSCEKNVYNLSAMPKDEAEALIAARSAGSTATGKANEVCIRFYQRADGTIMTADCPVGVTKKRRKKRVLALAGAGALAFGVVSAMKAKASCHRREVMGEMVQIDPTQVSPTVPAYQPPPPPVQTEAPEARPPVHLERHVQGRMMMLPNEK